MIKYLLLIILAVPRIIYSQIVLFHMRLHKNKYSLQQRYDVLRKTAMWVNKLTRCKLDVINKEIITSPHEKGRVYVSNHLSLFDCLAYIELSTKPLIFISKKENSKIPILRNHILAVESLFIDRKDPRQSLKVCKQAGLLAKEKNLDVVIFAEGTRSKNGCVNQFKAAFPTIIHYGEVETVLLCIYNSTAPLKFNLFTYPKANVKIKVFEPLSFEYYKVNRKEFSNVSHDIISKQLEEFKKEKAL